MIETLPLIIITAFSALIIFSLGIIVGWVFRHVSQKRTQGQHEQEDRERHGTDYESDPVVDQSYNWQGEKQSQDCRRPLLRKITTEEIDLDDGGGYEDTERQELSIDSCTRTLNNPPSASSSSDHSCFDPQTSDVGRNKTKVGKDGRRILQKRSKGLHRGIQGRSELELVMVRNRMVKELQRTGSRSDVDARDTISPPIDLPISRRPSSSHYSQVSPERSHNTFDTAESLHTMTIANEPTGRPVSSSHSHHFQPQHPYPDPHFFPSSRPVSTVLHRSSTISNSSHRVSVPPTFPLPALPPAVASPPISPSKSTITTPTKAYIHYHASPSSPSLYPTPLSYPARKSPASATTKNDRDRPPLPKKSPTRLRIQGLTRDGDGETLNGGSMGSNEEWKKIKDMHSKATIRTSTATMSTRSSSQDPPLIPVWLWGVRRDSSGTIEDIVPSQDPRASLRVANPDRDIMGEL